MKSLMRTIGIAGGLFLIAGIQTASAQVIDPVEFTTTFPFTVGYGSMPAGSYTIRPDSDTADILELQGTTSSVFFQVLGTQAPKTPVRTEVVFKRYGDAYILKDVWVSGSKSGAESIAAEGERHAAKRHGSATEERVEARKRAHGPAKH